MSETTSNLAEASIPAQEIGNQSPPPPGDLARKKTKFVAPSAKVFFRGLPTFLILGLLVGIAYWGHHYGWNLPKFSELSGIAKDAGELWCDEHGVPEADCISCNAGLMPKAELAGWCDEHGVHECVLHHPGLSQLKEPPEINQDDLSRAARAIAVRIRTKNDSGCKMHLRRIQFPSISAVNQAGIDINLVDRGPVIETIKTTGEISYDPTRVAHMASRAGGTVWRVEKRVGDTVEQGEVLALIDAAEVGRLKSQLLKSMSQLELATTTFERLSQLGGSVIPEKQVLKAKAAKAAAEYELESTIGSLSNLGLTIEMNDIVGQSSATIRSKLKTLGIPDSVIASLGQSHSANLIPVVSPRPGVVVSRNAVAGEVVETSKPLFTIADTSKMWLLLNVRLEEISRISIGQKIIFQADGSELETTGSVTWISTEVDSRTRTIQVRGELSNTHGRLRNETFGAGEIILREEQNAIVVPSNAVHWEGCCHVAFVRDKDYFKDGSFKVFHTRSVRPGATIGQSVEVIAGLLPGEVVVTKGSGILRAELLKGNLGAG